jgi:muconate cycloisomerase
MARITGVDVFPIEIPFENPFYLSRGYVGGPGRPGQHVYLKLTTSKGLVGWGESRPMPTWSYETMETVCTTLTRHIAPLLLRTDCTSIRAARRMMDAAITPSISTSQPFALSAVEQALYDLQGRECGLPICRMLGGELTRRVELCSMISGDEEDCVRKASDLRGRGYSCFKIKISGNPDRDAERLRTICNAVGEARVWADANQAYNALTFRRLLNLIADIPNIACLEQPLPTYDYPGLRRCVKKCHVPIAADESIFTHYDMLRAASMESADLVVLKLAKSGILANQSIAAVAEAYGVGLLGSGMTESGVGFACSVHLYSTMPMLLPVDINGPQFLSEMLVKGLRIDEPFVEVPMKPGIGVEVEEDRLEKLRIQMPSMTPGPRRD